MEKMLSLRYQGKFIIQGRDNVLMKYGKSRCDSVNWILKSTITSCGQLYLPQVTKWINSIVYLIKTKWNANSVRLEYDSGFLHKMGIKVQYNYSDSASASNKKCLLYYRFMWQKCIIGTYDEGGSSVLAVRGAPLQNVGAALAQMRAQRGTLTPRQLSNIILLSFEWRLYHVSAKGRRWLGDDWRL